MNNSQGTWPWPRCPPSPGTYMALVPLHTQPWSLPGPGPAVHPALEPTWPWFRCTPSPGTYLALVPLSTQPWSLPGPDSTVHPALKPTWPWSRCHLALEPTWPLFRRPPSPGTYLALVTLSTQPWNGDQ